MLRTIGRYALFVLYCLYIHLAYHLLLLGSFADWSLAALLFVPIAGVMFWLVPPQQRKAAIVYTLTYIFFDQAIQRVHWMETHWFILNSLFIGLFIYPIVRWYAKLKLVPTILALVIAFTMNAVLPERMVQGLSHLWPMAVTDELYYGELGDPSPLPSLISTGTAGTRSSRSATRTPSPASYASMSGNTRSNPPSSACSYMNGTMD